MLMPVCVVVADILCRQIRDLMIRGSGFRLRSSEFSVL